MLKDWSKEALKLCNQNIGNVRDFFWCENPERYWHFGEVDSSEASLLYSESRNTIDDHHDSENIRISVLRRLPIPSRCMKTCLMFPDYRQRSPRSSSSVQ